MQTTMRVLVLIAASLAIRASARWADHWNGFSQLTSGWLHDLDSNLCETMGQLLGAVPGRHAVCKWGSFNSKLPELSSVEAPLLASSPETKPTSASAAVAPYGDLAMKLEASERRVQDAKDESVRLLLSRIDYMAQAESQATVAKDETDRLLSRIDYMAQRIRQLETESKAAQEEIEATVVHLERVNLMCLVPDAPLSCFVPTSFGFVFAATLIMWFATFIFRGARNEHSDPDKQVCDRFDMSAGDMDDAWLYSDGDYVGQRADASVERAAQALRLAAAEGAVCKVTGLKSRPASFPDAVAKQSRSLSGAASSASSSSGDTGDGFEKVDEESIKVDGPTLIPEPTLFPGPTPVPGSWFPAP